ncbi:MAG: UDP-2-acetamido-3-amino-2,3-dideoxy-glucuronate N-acetyltransferase [Sphingobacteriales bacterium]|jgi:UDP-2-acetamido-3-amino-2,3-dideoxy-glucuronate N-acetyltransferase
MSDFFQHKTAIVDVGAMVGEKTKIWHFSHLMSKAKVGANCIIGQNVFIGDDVIVGNGVKIQNNVSLYTGVEIEEGVFIGPSAVFTNVINPRAFIERKNEFLSTKVGRGASIGANATIVCGNSIGEYSIIGAGSVITNAVLNFELVYGNPAKQKGWVSKAGHKLDFVENKAICPETGEKYQLENNAVKFIDE